MGKGEKQVSSYQIPFKLLYTHKPRTFFSASFKKIASDLDDKTGLCFLIGAHGIRRGHDSHIAGLCPRKSIEFNTHIIPQAYVSRTNAKIHVHYLI